MTSPETPYYNNNNISSNSDYSIFNLALNKKVRLINKIQGQFILFHSKKNTFIFNLNDITSLKFIDPLDS